MAEGYTILDRPDQIAMARLSALKVGLRLEIKGLTRRGRSCYSLLKDMGYKGNRAAVLEAVSEDIDNYINNREPIERTK